MNRMLEYLETYESASYFYKFVNTVHDSLVFEVHPDWVVFIYDIYHQSLDDINEFYKDIMKESKTCPLKQWVDMAGDAEIGPRYGTMYPLNKTEEGEYLFDYIVDNKNTKLDYTKNYKLLLEGSK